MPPVKFVQEDTYLFLVLIVAGPEGHLPAGTGHSQRQGEVAVPAPNRNNWKVTLLWNAPSPTPLGGQSADSTQGREEWGCGASVAPMPGGLLQPGAFIFK